MKAIYYFLSSVERVCLLWYLRSLPLDLVVNGVWIEFSIVDDGGGGGGGIVK